MLRITYLLLNFSNLYVAYSVLYNHYHWLCNLSKSFPDYVSCVFGPPEEHDLSVWPRNVPAVWRPNERVPHMPQGNRKEDPSVLNSGQGLWLGCERARTCRWFKPLWVWKAVNRSDRSIFNTVAQVLYIVQ